MEYKNFQERNITFNLFHNDIKVLRKFYICNISK